MRMHFAQINEIIITLFILKDSYSQYSDLTPLDSLSNNYHFWLYTGNNLFLINSNRLNHLYLQASYLNNFIPHKTAYYAKFTWSGYACIRTVIVIFLPFMSFFVLLMNSDELNGINIFAYK